MGGAGASASVAPYARTLRGHQKAREAGAPPRAANAACASSMRCAALLDTSSGPKLRMHTCSPVALTKPM
jgi:hypothetical protein